jgi:hypothetical protein
MDCVGQQFFTYRRVYPHFGKPESESTGEFSSFFGGVKFAKNLFRPNLAKKRVQGVGLTPNLEPENMQIDVKSRGKVR